MAMVQEEISRANRFYIGLFGRRNTGKSSLLNALIGQQVAIVSATPGTTTDVVQKNMELPDIGAAVLVDTAGFDDEGDLGELRVAQTRKSVARMDLALLIVAGTPEAVEKYELPWMEFFKASGIQVLLVYNKEDVDGNMDVNAVSWEKALGHAVLKVSAHQRSGLDRLRKAMVAVYRQMNDETDITGSLVKAGDAVVLVIPQDLQAPQGRLILPQVQTLRNLLDKKCRVCCCTVDQLPGMLSMLRMPPTLLITDSQVFPQVEKLCPPSTRLTSFSVLFARHKGDIQSFVEGAKTLSRLSAGSRVLIAEACAHVPRNEDIGRVKLPRLLHQKISADLQIDIVSGNDFPENLSVYDLIIHCGACMFTRRHVLNRLACASAQQVPMTNYGIAIAWLTGILDKVVYPK